LSLFFCSGLLLRSKLVSCGLAHFAMPIKPAITLSQVPECETIIMQSIILRKIIPYVGNHSSALAWAGIVASQQECAIADGLA
jgi:hypothetical protein